MSFDAVDLFAGPGGWDVAAERLGLNVVGLEWDDAAVQTRRTAGLPTVHGNVRDFGPQDFPNVCGLIASPPCQTFSAAGKGAGRAALDKVLELVESLRDSGNPIPYEAFDDERTGLVLEPLRWANEGQYDWLAFEQVPTVLPVWEAMASVLTEWGYSVATGKLSAEQYGVPQTRQRAFLVAAMGRQVQLPAPTHRPFRKGATQGEGDPSLRPWVSMAEALGWEAGVVGFPRRSDGLEAIEINGVEYRARDLRDVGKPAQVVTEKARSWERWITTNHLRDNATVRHSSEPAPTITAGKDFGERRWLPESVRVTVQEASILQSFPADYPWQGARTKQFQQIGNAVPPLLAQAVLTEAAQSALSYNEESLAA